MTIYGTPGGTTLNSTGFQGTQPGNVAQGTLQVVNPGVGMFPPNSNNNSGDTIMASVSRGACPANALATNVGTRDTRPGRSVHESMSAAASDGTNASVVNTFGASPNYDSAGSNSFGAGGMNQTNSPGSGEASILPPNAYVATVTIPNAAATPTQYQG